MTQKRDRVSLYLYTLKKKDDAENETPGGKHRERLFLEILDQLWAEMTEEERAKANEAVEGV